MRLDGIPGRVQAVLERKGQVILFGPPGTGKSYWAQRTARDLVALHEFGVSYDVLEKDRQAELAQGGFVRTCTFHPAYGYEDFLEGFRPQSLGNQLGFVLRDGIFKKLCAEARQRPSANYYLIVDEINRGDIPRIFGELLTLMEKSKRGTEVQLAVSGEAFQVPSNVFLIGTMNTADRSIALLDKALRRRFGFIELMPDAAALGEATLDGVPLGPWLEHVNRSVRQKTGRDARNLQIGHSYLMEHDRPLREFSRFAQILQDEIVPLLEEYCYEDYGTLAEILGKGLVDDKNQAIRRELFEDARRSDLIQALLEPYPEIATSREAVAAEAASVLAEGDEPESEPEN